VESIRSIRGAYAITRQSRLHVVVHLDNGGDLSEEQHAIVSNLENPASLKLTERADKPPFSASSVIPDGQVFVVLKGILDLDAEKRKLEKEYHQTQSFITSLENKLGNPRFIQNAPETIVAKEKGKLTSQQEKLAKLEAAIANFSE
jgi:valyl-tRNA synthetase